MSSADRLLRAIVLLFLCVMSLSTVDAGAIPLAGHWRSANPSDTPDQVRAIATTADPTFDPATLTLIPGGKQGAWVLLKLVNPQPVAEETARHPREGWVLQAQDPGLESISLFPWQGPPVLGANVLGTRDGWQGHGRIGFPIDRAELDRATSGKGALLLRVEPGRLVTSPLRFSLVSTSKFNREDERWLALSSACLAVMVAMAIMALLFAIELRDIAFVYYALYVVSYALILAIQTGYVAAPLEWAKVAHASNAWGRAATAVSVLSASLFLSRFAGLAHYAPRMRVAVLTMGYSTGTLMVLGSIPVASLMFVASILINPLLMLGAPIMLAASLLAWWRGSRYAGFFLLGWTPLLAVTVMGSAQIFGVLSTWTWLTDGSLITGALEALVLSLGLADRALSLRRDRDIAQVMADTDALTNVFNRRGLDRRVADLVERAQRQRRPLTVLFLDLDRFKLLNDRQGHAAGDAALVAVARLMRSDMRVQDVLGRYGGEEFLAALPGCDVEAALAIADRIRADLHALCIPVNSLHDVLTASLGVARLELGDDAQAVIARADRAMYVAKGQGGNRVSMDPALESTRVVA